MYPAKVVSVICQFACLLHLSSGFNGTKTENDLHRRLFEHYNPSIIPKINKSEPIALELEFFLIALDNVNEKKQSLSVRAFLSMEWTDDLLRWDEAEYPGVYSINVNSDQLWLPDLSLLGALDSLQDIGQTGGRALVLSNGHVTLWPYKLYTIACKISVTRFPIDEQTCTFDFISWTNPSSVLTIRNPSGSMNITLATASGEWETISLPTLNYARPFGGVDWDHVEFNILLRRKWLFYALNTMTPVVCISLLNVLCFLLPAQSGERVTLCISIFLTLAVFLTVINSSMPESSDEVAVFAVYVGLQLVGSALTIFCTVLSIYFYHKEKTRTVPLLFRALVRMCCVNSTTGVRSPSEVKKDPDVVEKDSIGDKRNSVMGFKPEGKHQITWASVSLAMDRFCLAGAICWHILLIAVLILKLNV